MNYSKSVFLINNKVRAINVNYDNERIHGSPDKYKSVYTFKSLDPTIKKDDLVIVPTDTRHGFTVVKVVDTDVDVNFDDPIEFKWIAGKFDRADFDLILSQEAEAIAKIRSAEANKKRKELRDALLADQLDSIKALPIAELNGDAKKD